MSGRSAKLSSLEIGQFKDKISIQKPTFTSDGQGGQTAAWAEVAAPWARIMPYRGRKNAFGDQNRATVTHMIYMPYETALDTTMRAVLGQRTWNLKSVIDVEEAHEFLEIYAEEGEPT